MLTDLGPLNADLIPAVAEFFDLGSVVRAPHAVAAGWAAHNIVWRFETSTGIWAVKQIGREPGPQVDAAAELEAAAHAAGTASPRPVPGSNGRWLCTVHGRTFRCHEWVDGHQPTSSLSERDAHQAGELLGHLHRLDLAWQQVSMTVPNVWGEQHWRTLTERAAALCLPWNTKLGQVIEPILAIEREAGLWAARPHRWIGSHRDVRPDNTLRVAGQIVLVDWDNAGPVVPGREVAKVLRWWAPHEERFLAGYTSAAGTVDLHEGTGENGDLLWWLELNARLALDEPLDLHRQHAVDALIHNLFPLPP